MSGATTAAVVAGSAVVGAGATMYAASQAAGAQEDAANQANRTQVDMFNTTQRNIAPYIGLGNKATTALTKAAGLDTDNPLTSALLKPITMDQATLEKTPGYQFQLAQGLKSAQNGAAARGLGVSGASTKAAETYAEGLADSNYQQQFENAVTNQNNQFNKLTSLVGTGQSSAVGQGQISAGVANSISNNTIGAGNARAAGDIAMGNAVNSGINNAIGYNYLNGALPWSDKRLKENIKFYRIENNIPMFEFNYVWDKTRKFIGVMAQQLAEQMPEAVINDRGVLKVDYKKAGITFREANHAR